jgi:hypothetical protein
LVRREQFIGRSDNAIVDVIARRHGGQRVPFFHRVNANGVKNQRLSDGQNVGLFQAIAVGNDFGRHVITPRDIGQRVALPNRYGSAAIGVHEIAALITRGRIELGCAGGEQQDARYRQPGFSHRNPPHRLGFSSGTP